MRKHFLGANGKAFSGIMFVASVFIVLGCLSSGCKKAEPEKATSSSAPQPSVSPDKAAARTTPEPIPEEALRSVQLGMEHARSHDYDKAIREFTAAIDQYPKYDMAYDDRAAVYVLQKKFDMAKADLEKALSINPHNPVTYYNSAALYAVQKQAAPALDNLDKALVMGFRDYDFLRKDPDLNNVRNNPEFRKILDKHGVWLPK
ncbi:MAG: hypothetical protein HQL08_11660 [Nitrospirae bacterium]|nr:hypothetical protein [Nitrospirota bacterium]